MLRRNRTGTRTVPWGTSELNEVSGDAGNRKPVLAYCQAVKLLLSLPAIHDLHVALLVMNELVSF